jgi:hypothetical protein
VLWQVQGSMGPQHRHTGGLQARAALHLGEGCLCRMMMFFCWGALLHLHYIGCVHSSIGATCTGPLHTTVHAMVRLTVRY